ncbi:MAG: hypothetical protein PHD48_08720 [Alphaproteobacteria bacterium]|nr:hypothetical protein [Alphaproteobacteria bacterium]
MDDSTSTIDPADLVLADENQIRIAGWPDEPLRVQEDHVDGLLLWCALRKATDISIQSDRPIIIEVDGTLYPITRRAMDSADITNVLMKIYGPDALAKLLLARILIFLMKFGLSDLFAIVSEQISQLF